MIFTTLLSAIGLGISVYIHRKQKAKKPLMCPRQAPCETVLTSPEAKTFGISNTVLGIVYYGVLFLLSLDGAVTGVSLNVQAVMILLTAGGFLFSLYLVRVQYIVIKQWCAWCLGSAVVATLLFISMILLFH